MSKDTIRIVTYHVPDLEEEQFHLIKDYLEHALGVSVEIRFEKKLWEDSKHAVENGEVDIGESLYTLNIHTDEKSKISRRNIAASG